MTFLDITPKAQTITNKGNNIKTMIYDNNKNEQNEKTIYWLGGGEEFTNHVSDEG